MTKPRTETPKREMILDVAEELFALHGYDGVTLRQIAKAAGVDVALASYYFGKKREIFEAAFLRRARVLNDLRRQALNDAEAAAGGTPPLEAIIEAFLRPIQELQMSGDKGWRNYCALVAYINSSSVWGREMMHRHFDPLVSRFIEDLKKVFPDTPLEAIYWGYQYMSGTLTLTMAQTGRIDRLSDGLCKSTDFKAAYDRMIPFIVAGFRSICGAEESRAG